MSDMNSSAQQQELIGLLQYELNDLLEFDYADLYGEDLLARVAVAQDLCQRASNLSNAAHLMGLAGVRTGCQHLARNFSAFARAPELLGEHNHFLFEGWCPLLLNYVVNFCKAGEADAIEFFLDYLASDEWLDPLSPDQLGQLRADFASVEGLWVEATQASLLPEFVDDDWVSMRVDPDVNAELLDGLLLELPGQSQAFARSIEALVRSHDYSALPLAQRAAHTIKGAANVVGIRGIANLMHYVEDILDGLAKTYSVQGAEPLAVALQDLLEDAADCLASMTEYLLGLGPYPEQAQEVLSRVIAWLKLAAGGSAMLGFTPGSDDEHLSSVSAEYEFVGASPGPECQPTHEPEPQPVPENALWYAPVVEVSELQESWGQDTQVPAFIALEVPLADAELIPIEQSPVAPFLPSPPPAVVELPAAEDVSEVRHQLSVSDVSAQELLRLAGENQISTNQVLTRIGFVVGGVKSADAYHQKIRKVAAELEQLVQSQSIRGVAQGALGEGELDPLEMERYNELHSFSSQLQELTTDAHEAILSIENQLKDLANLVVEQRRRSSEAQVLLLQIRMLPVSLISPRLTRCVRQAARLTYKSVLIDMHGEDVLVDSRVLNMVVDPLMHLLRNAVDHGIELSAQQRLDQGKTAEGKISVNFIRRGEILRIEVRDDGKGFDYFGIEQLARARGFLEAYQPVTRSELHKILLTAGFSTRHQASQTSGRGIGLDVVHNQVRLLKGSFTMESEPGLGSAFVLEVPMSILSAHTLQVRMGHHNFSVLSRPLSQIIHLQSGDIDWRAEMPQFQLGAERLDVLCLDDIATVRDMAKPEHYGALLVVNRANGGRVAVAIEAVLTSEEQIIKPLNKYASKPEGVIGVAILGDGSLSPVVDLQELPRLQMQPEDYLRWLETNAQIRAAYRPVAPKPIALVVDDSLSSRRSLAQFMRDLGMDVCTAKDGFEAIQVMQQYKPSILLVDLEMPRMNGLELTAHIRASANADLPIVMVTSRITEKHKQMATAAGVDAYINKPWSEEELLQAIEAQLPELS